MLIIMSYTDYSPSYDKGCGKQLIADHTDEGKNLQLR